MSSWSVTSQHAPVTDASREADRNEQLRRIDWRFLLTDPAPRRSICWAGTSFVESLRRISHDVSDGAPSGAACADLVVDAEPNAARALDAFTALVPGGDYAARWRLVGPLARRAARQLLERAGFRDVHFYWMWPLEQFGSPEFWLPLDAPGDIGWFFRSRQRGHGMFARTRSASIFLGWLLARSFGLLNPTWVVARKLTPESPSATKPRILITAGRRSINKVLAFWSSQPGSTPDTVLKMPRTPEGWDGLEREATVLSTLPQPIVGVPRLLDCNRERRVVAETLLSGDAMTGVLTRESFEPLANRATAWLANFAHATSTSASDNLVDSIADTFEQQWAAVLDPADWRTCKTSLSQLHSLHRVCEHRDFAPWNLLVSKRGDLRVLDWESAVLRGLPGLDLIYFLAYGGFFVDGTMRSGQLRKAYADMLNPTTPLGRVRAGCLEAYMRALDLPVKLQPALGMLTWMIHARSEFRRIVEDHTGPPAAERLRAAQFWQLWQEEVQHAR